MKEATVFRTLVPTAQFLRPDHSVDLYKARQSILSELSLLIGEVRDYNGGMIYKQNELLNSLKSALGRIAEQHNILLEKFYYSLNPIEMRTSLDVDHLRQLFLLLLQAAKTDHSLRKKSGDFLFKQDVKRALAVVPVEAARRKLLSERIEGLSLPTHQLVSFFLETGETSFAGYLLLSDDSELQKRFLNALEI